MKGPFPCRSDFSRDAFQPAAQEASRLKPLQQVIPAAVTFVDINQRIDACFPTT